MGQQRGRLTPLPERQKIINLVSEAVSSGARKTQACQCIGISVRTLQRWMQGGVLHADQRPGASRRTPGNKLSETERLRILDVCNSPEFASLSPNIIVPTLAAYSALFDHGLASKSDQRFAYIRSTGNLTFSTAF
ncbi:helix-turn-helix domain-containing protein [Escherichia coli O117:H42]